MTASTRVPLTHHRGVGAEDIGHGHSDVARRDALAGAVGQHLSLSKKKMEMSKKVHNAYSLTPSHIFIHRHTCQTQPRVGIKLTHTHTAHQQLERNLTRLDLNVSSGQRVSKIHNGASA